MYGDYETLMTGYAADAMVDFTGGVAEKVDYNNLHLEEEENQESHFRDLLAASENSALIICNMAVSRSPSSSLPGTSGKPGQLCVI